MNHSPATVFVDESGDHGLLSIDPTYPVFVLAFCIFDKAEYATTTVRALTEFKFRHFGHDQVILHERDIRKDLGDMVVLRDAARKAAFVAELTDLIAALQFRVVASVIDKPALVRQYANPSSPYHVALQFGMERVLYALNRAHASQAGRVPIILERRGKKEDDELELEFRRVSDALMLTNPGTRLEPVFIPKSSNAPGLQIADLIARPIGRYVMNPAQPNRAFDVISQKMDRSAGGEIKGWGLKVFP